MILEQPTAPVVLADGRGGGSDRPTPLSRALVRFAVGTALALIVVVVASAVVAKHAAENQAESEVRRVTGVLGATLIETNLDDSLLTGDPAAKAQMDRIVRRRLLAPTDLRRIKLWTPDGRVVYSDDPRAIGQRFPLSPRQLDSVRTGQAIAQVSDLEEPENDTERDLGSRLLEVYTGVHTPSGRPLMLEAYYSYDVALSLRSELVRSSLSLGVVALICFLVIQVGIGSLALRWLRQQHRRLLDASSRAAERERSRIASGLHDGMVQDLVGASYALASVAAMARKECSPQVADALEPAARTIRTSVQGLRSMIVDIYPTAVHEAGLAVALTDLVAPARTRGMTVTVDIADGLTLPRAVEETLYRCALEATRNVLAHSASPCLSLAVHVRGGFVDLVVSDDGIGFDPEAGAEPGHVGLRVMADLVQESGGVLEVVTAPGRGTTLRASIPLATTCQSHGRLWRAVYRLGTTGHVRTRFAEDGANPRRGMTDPPVLPGPPGGTRR
jgi:signal transduction histidine kinase